MLQLELKAKPPLIEQLDQQLHGVVPSLLHLVSQVLGRALPQPVQELSVLAQLHGRLVVFELALQLQELVLQLALALQNLLVLSVVELEPLPPEYWVVFGQALKYLAQQLASVLVGHLHLVLQQAYPPAGCSGSRSPTLQELMKGLIGNARTSLQRANHLHRNLVLKTLSAPLRSHFHRPAG
jgi:hypothetical protein